MGNNYLNNTIVGGKMPKIRALNGIVAAGSILRSGQSFLHPIKTIGFRNQIGGQGYFDPRKHRLVSEPTMATLKVVSRLSSRLQPLTLKLAKPSLSLELTSKSQLSASARRITRLSRFDFNPESYPIRCFFHLLGH